jgi:voltage-gated potassium channel
MSVKSRLRQYLEDEENPKKRGFDALIICLVIISVGTYILQLSGRVGGAWEEALVGFDHVLVGVFALEYLARVYVATDFLDDWRRYGIAGAIRGKVRFMTRPLMLIDLIALLPATRAIRITRLFRLLRLLRLVRYQSSVASIAEIFREHAFELATVFAYMLAVLATGAVAVFLVENPKDHPESQIKDLGDAFWWAIVTMTTVGYGDKVPLTTTGRIIAGFVVVSGILVIAFPTAIITSAFTDKLMRLKEGKLDMTRLSKHVVVCGVNRSAEMIVKELQTWARSAHRALDVVVVSSYADAKVELPDGTLLKRGEMTRESTLKEVGIESAASVIILAERRTADQPDENIDARTLVTAMHVSVLNPDAYLVVEVLVPENVAIFRRHVPRAETIESGAIAPRLMAVATMHRGVNLVIREILAPGKGENDMFQVEVTPEALARTPTFGAALAALRKTPALPVAVRRDREVKTNPPDDYALAEGDVLLTIAAVQPVL